MSKNKLEFQVDDTTFDFYGTIEERLMRNIVNIECPRSKGSQPCTTEPMEAVDNANTYATDDAVGPPLHEELNKSVIEQENDSESRMRNINLLAEAAMLVRRQNNEINPNQLETNPSLQSPENPSLEQQLDDKMGINDDPLTKVDMLIEALKLVGFDDENSQANEPLDLTLPQTKTEQSDKPMDEPKVDSNSRKSTKKYIKICFQEDLLSTSNLKPTRRTSSGQAVKKAPKCPENKENVKPDSAKPRRGRIESTFAGVNQHQHNYQKPNARLDSHKYSPYDLPLKIHTEKSTKLGASSSSVVVTKWPKTYPNQPAQQPSIIKTNPSKPTVTLQAQEQTSSLPHTLSHNQEMKPSSNQSMVTTGHKWSGHDYSSYNQIPALLPQQLPFPPNPSQSYFGSTATFPQLPSLPVPLSQIPSHSLPFPPLMQTAGSFSQSYRMPDPCWKMPFNQY